MTTITLHNLMTLLPLLIVGGTVLLVMLCIAWRRIHFTSALVTIVGLNCALLSLFWVYPTIPVAVTPLFQIDAFSVFYIALVLIASLASATFAYSWLRTYPDNKEEFYLLLSIATLGAVVLACSNHLAALFVGIELLSLPLFGLVGYAYQQKRSLEASIKYTVLSAAASSFLLFGMALLYADFGSLSFNTLGNVLAINDLHRPLAVVGVGMILVGFGFKLSLVPFHLWTPDVYQGAPAPVSAFLATASKIAVFGVLVRLFLYSDVFSSNSMMVLSVIATCSILFGNLMALWQSNIKRMLGYSAIAHFGYLLVALIAVKSHDLSITAVGVYLAGYLFSSIGAFGVVSLVSSPYSGADADSMFSYRGLFWNRPVLATVMTVMMLSLAGIPVTLGFIGKFYILAVGVGAELWWLTGTIVVGSAIGLFYYLRTTISLYLSPPHIRYRDTEKHWALTAGGIVILASSFLVLLLGIYPQPLIDAVFFSAPLTEVTQLLTPSN